MTNGRLTASDSEKARTYYHYVSDQQGSVRYVIDSGIGKTDEAVKTDFDTLDERILNHYEYDAFGNLLECEERVYNPFRYTGEQYDRTTQLYYLGARYYNPVIGRFMQQDTYLGDGLNLYAYVQNNPVRYVDPSGHCKKNGMESSGEVGGSRIAPEDYVDLTDFRKDHILNNHRSGANKSGKTEFPADWSDDKILHYVSDVATDPNSVTGYGKWNSPYAIGTREGIEIRVDFYPESHPKYSGMISTAYPTNTPKNP